MDARSLNGIAAGNMRIQKLERAVANGPLCGVVWVTTLSNP